MINVNLEEGAELLKQCHTMMEYSQFIAAVTGLDEETIKDLE